MARINLLPWRENLRKQRKRNFLLQLLGAALLALGALAGWHFYVQSQIDYQKSRNDFLRAEIAKVDRKIREIRDIDKKRAELIARMNVIQQLQVSRPQVVHLFDELVKTIPEGVYLEKLVQNGDKVTLDGWAQSNARVSSYMRNIDKSAWLKDADLKVIQRNAKKNSAHAGMNRFKLVAKQANPNAKEEDEEEGDQGKTRKKG